MSAWDKLVDYWQENIRQNIKKISASMGQMIISLIALILLVVKEGYDPITALILIAIAMQPFFNWWINLIFKGESDLKDQEILQLKTRLEYQQEISGYQIQLAAKDGSIPGVIVNVHDWNEINRKIEELQNKVE